MQTLNFDEFLRSLKQNIDNPHVLLLGAGASVESGIPSALDCIWDWKREIFLSQNSVFIEAYNNTKIDDVRYAIQNWLDTQGMYPGANADTEYSFYAEKAYPIADDRRKYFQHLVNGKKPSLGYHIISMLAEMGIIMSVWTTNFDGLMTKCANQYEVTPIEITLESVDRIYRNETANELLCIALHGDYKYGELKNTESELDLQNDTLIRALRHELMNHDLIVLGYSGRDKSLMAALSESYQEQGSGKVFWCGYGQMPNDTVRTFIDTVNTSERSAYYIPTDGFDKTLYSIARHCMGDDSAFLQRIEKLKNELASDINISTNKFKYNRLELNKIIDTNIFPIVIPKNCFQFKILFGDDEKPWDYCKTLYKNNIMAVPYKGIIYAWGSKEHIQQICSDRLVSDISLIPFTRDRLIQIGVFKELLVKTITFSLAQINALENTKDKIWDTKSKYSTVIGSRSITTFRGVQISLMFDNQLTYISLIPTFMFENDIILNRDEKKQFADSYNNSINSNKPNYNIHKYISNWVERLLKLNKLRFSFPLQCNTGFDFTIGSHSAVLGVENYSHSKIRLPDGFNSKRIILNGVECHDPEMKFFNPQQEKIVTDYHPMRGITKNAPYDYYLHEKIINNSISIGIICPDKYNKQFYDFINQLNCKQSVKYNIDYVIPYPGFYGAYKTNLNIPTSTENHWISYAPPQLLDIKKASIELGNLITKELDRLSSTGIDVALIYIPKEYEFYTGYSDEMEKYDLHDYVKAYAVQKNISTQFVREKTIESDMYCQIMWALSLAIYVKSSRIPWTMSEINRETAFAGIGYSVNQTSSGTNIVVGCSHIYSSDGQGMKYKLSKVDEVTFDRKLNPFLSENEAYRLGLNIKELFYRSFTEIPKRVVIHKRTPFRKEEIKGITESLESAGIRDIELLEVTFADDIRCFEFNKYMDDMDGYPVRRGLCFPLNENTMYLYTHGIVPSIRNPYYRYIQGGKTIPLPLKIVKHYGNGTMIEIATEILGLSKMNWNSFSLYSKLPCTIESSNEIARIGWLLSQYEGAIYDYRYFM